MHAVENGFRPIRERVEYPPGVRLGTLARTVLLLFFLRMILRIEINFYL